MVMSTTSPEQEFDEAFEEERDANNCKDPYGDEEIYVARPIGFFWERNCSHLSRQRLHGNSEIFEDQRRSQRP